MEITLDKKNHTEASIKITLKESDYQPKFEQKVKEYSKKANLKGFREGKVPPSIIKKMYGKSILVEEINHILSHSLTDYIKENDLKIIGEPLPDAEKTRSIDWENQKEFEFEYNIGLIDNFDYAINNKLKVKSYKINVDKKTIHETIENLRKQYGKMTNPDVSEPEDSIYGELRQVDGDHSNNGLLNIPDISKKEQKKFTGVKPGDIIKFDIQKAFTDEESLSQLTGLSPEESKKLKGPFEFEVKNINRVEEAPLDQDFFDRIFGKDTVKNEEEFIEKIKDSIGKNYEKEAGYFLESNIKDLLIDKIKIELPHNFLKDWLKTTNEGKITDEDIEKEYDSYARELKWNLIKNRIVEDNNIDVQQEEVLNKARELIREQYGGALGQLEDSLDSFVENYLKANDGENYMRVVNVVKAEKIFDFIKENITITEKKVSTEEFKNIVTK